jgi:hypothetical protein
VEAPQSVSTLTLVFARLLRFCDRIETDLR